MPFVVHRIGLTKFGTWMLVNSVVGYMGLLDLGLAPTVVKKSAELLAKEDKDELNRTISTVFTLYLLIGALVGVTILGLGFTFPFDLWMRRELRGFIEERLNASRPWAAIYSLML